MAQSGGHPGTAMAEKVRDLRAWLGCVGWGVLTCWHFLVLAPELAEEGPAPALGSCSVLYAPDSFIDCESDVASSCLLEEPIGASGGQSGLSEHSGAGWVLHRGSHAVHG